MAFDPNMFSGGLASVLSGIFNNSSAPYDAASSEYQKYLNQAKDYQNPFYKAGTAALPQFGNWLDKMQDPTGFINQLMGNYQQSPYAKFQQQQAQRAATNSASASGLIGSTPYMQAGQDYARQISSQDMNQWLQNVLGINTQYGSGLNELVSGGQNAANSITDMLGKFGQGIGEAAYGSRAGQNFDMGNLISGSLSAIGSFL